MSQSSRLHASRPSRLRERLARELIAQHPRVTFTSARTGLDAGGAPFVTIEDLTAGRVTFDVDAAREHAAGLLALEAEHEAFVRWTRAQGLGRENREPGAFGRHELRCGECGVVLQCYDCIPGCRGQPKIRHGAGGWPGKLAKSWADLPSPDCEMCEGEAPVTLDGVVQHCEGCHGERDSRAPMGRSLARLGQQLLDMLDAKTGSMWEHARYQPSSCRGTQGIGFVCDSLFDVATCSACQGTGHNLRGVLPAVGWSPQIRRKVSDSRAVRGASRNQAWTGNLAIPGTGSPTRAVARGEHRNIRGYVSDGGSALDIRISKRGWYTLDLASRRHAPRAQLPRWLRGELERAEQLKAKAAREYTDAVDRMREGEPFML